MPAPRPEGAFKPNLYVVARFLDRLCEPQDWTQASLQTACRVNDDIYRRYVAVLHDRGIMSVAGTRCQITEEGRQFRNRLRRLLFDFLGGR